MYLFDELKKWDHSTRKVIPQLDSEFSKFYKRVKSIYSHKNNKSDSSAAIELHIFRVFCFNFV